MTRGISSDSQTTGIKNNIMINKQTVIDTFKRSMRQEGIM